ncbi:MAG TPA: 3-keto-5-aminohexanoate cleavage protein [Xanthobacteraceae bacterium]|nr:3-keto-5-aminohexanoate cleavage protein [Xanthobacteraceae bacterium]
MSQPPLIITAACGYTRPRGDDRPERVPDIIEAVCRAHAAGAAVAQIRAPHSIDPATGRPVTSLDTWIELVEGIRSRCDILIHAGVAAMPIEQRIELLRIARPEFASFLLNHHGIVVRGRELASLRTRPDMERLLAAHIELGVQPEFEVFHAGATRNLQFLAGKFVLPAPLCLTLFFGWDGGEWSPPTVEELLNRLRVVPVAASWTITAAGPEQMSLHAVAIGRGGHVRAGLGDDDEYLPGLRGGDTAEWVARFVRLAGDFGRPVAAPQQARALLCSARA